MVKRKCLHKMMKLYLSIILIYTVITSTIIFYKGFEISNIQTNHTHQVYIDQISNYADSKINIALDFIYKISTLPSFIDYRYSPNTNYFYITNLYNDLTYHLKGFNQLDFTLGITKFTDDIVITPNGTYSYKHYLEELGINFSSINNLNTTIHQLKPRYTYVIPKSIMNASSNKIILIHQLVGTSQLSPVYFFIVLDNKSLLTEVYNQSPGNVSIYTNDFISSLTQNLNIEETTTDYVSYFTQDNLPDTLILDSNINYIRKSNIIPNLKYIYTTPSTSIFSILLNVLKSSLIPGIIFFIGGSWIAYRAAQSTYQPIYQLLKFLDIQQNNYKSINYSTTSNLYNNELDYIQSKFNEICILNNDLQNKWDTSLLRLQEDFFRKVIYNIATEHFIEENLPILNLTHLKENLNLILLDCEGIENINKIFPTQNLSFVIYDFIKQFDTNNAYFFILPLDTKKYCIIYANKSLTNLYDICTSLINKMICDFSLDITACISSTYPLKHLSLGFQEALVLSNYKYINHKNKILTSESIQEIKEINYYYPIEIETCLINYICNNEFNKAKNLLLELLKKNLESTEFNYLNIENLKYSLVTTFKRCLNNDGKTLNQFIKEHPEEIDNFTKCPIYDLEIYCLKIFEDIFNYCNKDKFNLENSTASSIFIYIHENFDKDISLTDIAQHFKLSESYISKLIKNSLDINFKSYVNKLKVNKAKELLSQGNYKVNEVSSIIGCNNTNTFIRIFKQYEGVSPGEYIKSLNKLNI